MFDESDAGWTLVALGATYLIAWIVYAATGNVRGAVVIVVVASAASNTLIHVDLGGYANSGAILMWAIALTLIAAVTLGRNATVAIALFFVVEAVAFSFAEQSLQASRSAPDPALPAQMFAIVLVGTLLIVMPLIGALLNRLSSERQRAEKLLLNVLPKPVAAELKRYGHATARRFESVSVLFADIVDFTPMSAHMDPDELVELLNDVFTHFDSLTLDHDCEKIRTIGDAYMVAAGVPSPRADHAQALAEIALAMNTYAEHSPLTFRIGINSGPVVAGVIGASKFQYDVWGDTVNIASRMESHGEPGKIHISESTRELLKDAYRCTLRGPIEVKGKGILNTWYLDRKSQAESLDQEI
jgi:guanylate cyclase